MSGGSYFEIEWAITACTWTLSIDVGIGLSPVGTVTLPAGTRTTTGHLLELAAALSDVGGEYALQPWAAAPAGERPTQRWCIVEGSGALFTWRLTAGTGSDREKLGLAATTITSTDLVVAPSTWIYGVWAPPLHTFKDDRRYTKNLQSFTTTWTKAPLVIRHTQRHLRTFHFQYVPGRFVRGAFSPNADAAQQGTQGTFEDIWDALSLGQTVRYWPDLDDTAFPSPVQSVKIAMESADAAAGLLDCLDPEAFAEFGRDAHHVMFRALEVL